MPRHVLAAWVGGHYFPWRFAVVEGHRQLGYLLHDGVLYVPGQQSRLRFALHHFGDRVV